MYIHTLKFCYKKHPNKEEEVGRENNGNKYAKQFLKWTVSDKNYKKKMYCTVEIFKSFRVKKFAIFYPILWLTSAAQG